VKDAYVRSHDQGRNHAVEYFDGTETHWTTYSKPHLAEAAKRAIQLLMEDEQPILVREFIDRWIALHVLANVKPPATTTYLRCTREAAIFFGDMSLRDVTTKDILRFIDKKRVEGLRDRRITPALNILSSMFSAAKRWHYIPNNPVSGVDGLLLGGSEVQR
jgi:hypothetical protein